MISVPCDVRHYDKKSFPNFAKPVEIGVISMDCNRKQKFDKSQLKLLHLPSDPTTVNFDLNHGFDCFIQKADDEKLENLLAWIIKNKNMNNSSNLKQLLYEADFVSWRGLLTRIASTLYQPKDEWIFCVTKFQNVYFLCEFYSDKKKLDLEKISHRERLMTFWGHNFETFVTRSPTPVEDNEKPQTSEVVNCNEEFGSIVRTKLSDHRLIFGAEVDCLDQVSSKYVELKTNRLIETPKQSDNFKRKLVKWWLQSFLIGIEKIIYGLRNDSGIVTQLETVPVSDLPAMCKTFWSPSACFNFLTEFLSDVRNNVTLDDPRVVYKFEYQPNKRRIIFERDYSVEHRVLPDWFLAEFQI